MSDAHEEMLSSLKVNHRTGRGGIASICSAHPTVLEACMDHAKEDGSILLIESTSNQVDQFGGYTGMTPARFRAFVQEVAEARGFSPGRIILGGDHLGPNRWRGLREGPAMENAAELVRNCVQAGYAKIHLDASMHLAGDPGVASERLSDEVVAERTAFLAKAGDEAAQERGGSAPYYVIGTEVPVPGGAKEPEETVTPTTAEDAHRTIDVTQDAFHRKNLDEAWGRVIAVVVQPGVEFTNDSVIEYEPAQAAALSHCIQDVPGLVFEAHSTDYQTGAALRRMVHDHFCILKVGPALTFAFREAILALDRIEEELIQRAEDRARVREHLEKEMQENPAHWKPYSQGSEMEQRITRTFGFSDRSRYYWGLPRLQQRLGMLLTSLTEKPVPLTLLSQYLPRQYEAVRNGLLSRRPQDWVRHRISEVVDLYAGACR